MRPPLRQGRAGRALRDAPCRGSPQETGSRQDPPRPVRARTPALPRDPRPARPPLRRRSPTPGPHSGHFSHASPGAPHRFKSQGRGARTSSNCPAQERLATPPRLPQSECRTLPQPRTGPSERAGKRHRTSRRGSRRAEWLACPRRRGQSERRQRRPKPKFGKAARGERARAGEARRAGRSVGRAQTRRRAGMRSGGRGETLVRSARRSSSSSRANSPESPRGRSAGMTPRQNHHRGPRPTRATGEGGGGGARPARGREGGRETRTARDNCGGPARSYRPPHQPPGDEWSGRPLPAGPCPAPHSPPRPSVVPVRRPRGNWRTWGPAPA